jgi:2-(1,2-epoxy-1,2-dihydrophenyl)acetyl-CoA isomerase
MSQYETVNIERHGAVAVVSLNRPDVLNAFNSALIRDLLSAVEEVNQDDDIRVGILTGEGRAFSAGADLGETIPEGQTVIDQLTLGYKPILMGITDAPQPWISAVNGAAAGIGSAFAMNCDLTVMAENGYIYQAFTAIGLIPDGGACWHLSRTLGRKRAYELIVSGDKMYGQQCLDLGLCNRVVAADDLLSETLAWAQELAQKSPLSLRYAKAALNSAMTHSVADTISNEADLQHLCINSDDAKEGVIAFLQKRAPDWKGR